MSPSVRHFAWVAFAGLCLLSFFAWAIKAPGEQWQAFVAGFFCMWGIFKAAE